VCFVRHCKKINEQYSSLKRTNTCVCVEPHKENAVDNLGFLPFISPTKHWGGVENNVNKCCQIDLQRTVRPSSFNLRSKRTLH
jgi:hypothetical protein